MDAKKIFILVLVICIALSIGIVYYFEKTKQTELICQKNYYECELENLNSYISYIEISKDLLNQEIVDIEKDLSNLTDELYLTNISLKDNLSEIEKLKSGNFYELHDPTYKEVANFIEQDKTDEQEYIDGVFDCEQFSQQFNTNAEQIGIRCAYVVLYFEGTDAGHGIVGFNTIDQGMVYVEPQSDEWVRNLEIGNDFWTDCLIPNGNYYYEEAPNDTIKDIILFW